MTNQENIKNENQTNSDINVIKEALINQFKELIDNGDFIQNSLYEKFKTQFAKEVKDTILNQKELWVGDIGYITSEVKNQGTKSGEVIKNVKVKFEPSKKFRKEINNYILGK